MKSEKINELATALAAAQAEIGGAKKDSTNPHFKTKYADLASVWEAIRVPLSKHKLAVTQTVEGPDLVTTLMHASGQYIESRMAIVTDRAGIQAFGAALSYLRRYSLAAIVGVYQEDDDAETASVKPAQQAPQAAPKPQPAKVTPKAQAPEQAPLKPTEEGKRDGAYRAISEAMKRIGMTPEALGAHCQEHYKKAGPRDMTDDQLASLQMDLAEMVEAADDKKL